jgi:uncharacterized coiled-coil DUF342 family protein
VIYDEASNYAQCLSLEVQRLRDAHAQFSALVNSLNTENDALRSRVKDLEHIVAVTESSMGEQKRGINALNHDYRELEKKYFALKTQLRVASPVDEDWETVGLPYSDA